jgi:hypothetical protein
MLHHGWWWSPRNQELLELYQEAIAKGVKLIRGGAAHKPLQPNSAVALERAPASRVMLMGRTLANPAGRAGMLRVFSIDGKLLFKANVVTGCTGVELPASAARRVAVVRFAEDAAGQAKAAAGR